VNQPIEDIYELSPLQQGILFHSLYAAPESGVYVVQVSYRIQANLDIFAFEQAWQQVIARHTVLRTSFHWQGLAKPLQVVHPQVKLIVRQEDWRSTNPDEQQTQLIAWLDADRQQGFAFDQVPLMRLTLIRFAEQDYQLIWSKHHLILDGWSTALVLKDVVQTYDALTCGQPNAGIETRRPYRDYIGWLHQQDLQAAESLWRRTLQGFTTPTILGIERRAYGSFKNLDRTSEQYGNETIQLSSDTTARLQALARQQQLTLNTVIQGAWALILSRYSGDTDVLFGATVSGRPADLVGAESMIGLFINTIPARVQITPHSLLLPWLKRIQTQQAALRQYEFTPLVKIQEWSEMPRGVPLFESILVFENHPIDPVLYEWGNQMHISDARALEQTHYPLTVTAIPGTELAFKFSYDERRFDAIGVAQLARSLHTLLEEITADPDRHLSTLSVLSTAAIHQQQIKWNNTYTSFENWLQPLQTASHDQSCDIFSSCYACLHRLIEAQAKRTPTAIALTTEEEQINYIDLNDRANQLAQYLRTLGVQSNDLIGVCLDRSIEMVIGLLGVLKAGAAYVPLDPAYPAERLAFMLKDAEVKLVLTQKSLVEQATPLANALDQSQSVFTLRVVHLDTEWHTIRQMSSASGICHITPDDRAYVIYTSGSTGQPKGVQVSHRAVVNVLMAIGHELSLTPDDIWLAVTTLSFDIAALELFLPLIVGAKGVVASRAVAIDAIQLSAVLAKTNATVMQATPATWRMLLAAGWQGHPCLKILCGGEALSKDLVEPLLQRSAAVWNVYGPTETTIWSTIHAVQPTDHPIPIGRPIANTQVYILDHQLDPVPTGVPGELYIGGIGLAQGYLNRPALTAERFIANPFYRVEGGKEKTACLPSPSSLLYKTGDLVRYRPDGCLEFLGRLDHQVKLRGFRIELGEIEAVLRQHTAVRDAAVIVHERESGDRRLVAYVVLPLDSADSAELMGELRRHLEQQLPNPMIPAIIVYLNALPLTPNGKVDRRQLPDPEEHNPVVTTPYIAPKSNLEQLIASVWRSVLGLEKVGIHDNFFDLGGHSLLMLQVYSQLQDSINHPLSLVDLFAHPTVQALAQYLSQDKPQPLTTDYESRAETRRELLQQQRQRRHHKSMQR
jgi:surfactin family lipopeptide synthetase C